MSVLAKKLQVQSDVADPYFKYVPLLLTGDGTNGAQNNTFLDSSSNNFTITRNGNTTQGTFSPYGDLWSNYFDGTGDYLSIGTNAAFDLSSGNWTIEGWVYPTTLSGYHFLYNLFSTAGSPSGLVFGLNSTGKVYIGNGVVLGTAGNTSVPLNTWSHIAAVKNGSNVILYLNGVADVTSFAFTPNAGGYARIGANANAGDTFYGYISNARIVKGTAVYTSNFTPSTTPLTAVSGTSLLTCQSNRFKDNSSNNFTISVNGDTKVTRFSPFNPTAAYDAATIGGSGYFDGTGDYLSVADNANLRFGTSAFTIQAWVYRNAAGATHSILSKGGASTGFTLGITSTNVLRFTDTTTNIDTTTTIPANTWTHVAAVRTNTSTNGFQLYINGVSAKTATVSTDFNQTNTLYVGADRGAANVMNGYITDLRCVNGTAETITVPTAPITAITNTSLLCNCTNAGIPDAAMMNDLETVGNAQVSTSVKKYGTGSLAFDGTGDRLLAVPNQVLDISTGDFTVECWVNFSSLTGDKNVAFRGLAGNVTSGSEIQWAIYSSGTTLYVRPYQSTTDFSISLGTIATGTWYHIALVREGTTVKGYLNGTASGTTRTVSGALNNNTAWYGAIVGLMTVGGVDQPFNGYIDDLRITKGYARYTTNFTPPTQALPLY